MALLALVVLALLYGSARSEPTQDRAALLDFMTAVRHKPRLQWGANASACDWAGVTCDAGRTVVLAFRLPGVGLVGSAPSGTLGRLSGLRFLSLRSNRLSGSIPTDLAGLVHLRGLYLQNNLFSGGIPAELAGLTSIVRLDLSSNNLTGPVPFALNNLTHLTGLFLQNNHLRGSLPSIGTGSLRAFNVSNNELNGSIPRTLERFPASAFAGNLDLCGGPLPSCKPFFPSPAAAPATVEGPAKGTSKKLSTAAIIAIAVASATVLLLLVLLVLVICLVLRRRRKGMGGKKEKSTKGVESAATMAAVARSGETGMTSSSKEEMSGSGSVLVEAERNKLVFVGANSGYSFDLEDLLRASAEVLGKGSTGTSYKAVLEEGNTVVVKRIKDVAVAKPDFESHLHTLGKVEHPNLLTPRAFYYSKDEKLLVLDYLPAGSLSSLLHGNRGSGRTPLGWESRLRVAISAGRGLTHLHTAARLVHGNVKASNVLLRGDDPDSATLSDFTLHPLFNSAAPRHRLAGYRAPEVAETRRPTFKSDVYSFGVLLLELLTGKAPNQASLGEEGIDLPRWVQSVVREEWTAEVFDVELMRYPDTEEEEMVQLLQVAMACVATVPDARPDVAEVVRMMEQIANRAEGDEGPKSSPAGPANDGERAAPPAAAAP